MITRQIVLRYRGPGYVRFQLPSVLGVAEAAGALLRALRQVDGIYRVRLSGNKLVIRWNEALCDFREVARQLHAVATRLEQEGVLTAPPVQTRRGGFLGVTRAAPLKWLRQRIQDVRETLTAFGILMRQGFKRGPKFLHDPKALAHEFANDLLVLYLIRLHWHRIVTQWIPNPIKHRYEWAAVFYMTYLLVRSRLPKK